MIGHFATAKAGHDAGGLYVIVREEAEYVYLCDGRLRPMARPKKKNRKHIQTINKTVNEEIQKRLLNQENVSDHEIRYAIKQYLAIL